MVVVRLRARGFSLAESEEAALRIATAEQFAALIDRIDTSEGNLKRRRFMRAVAATVVTIAAGQGTAACSGPAEQVSADPPDEPLGG